MSPPAEDAASRVERVCPRRDCSDWSHTAFEFEIGEVEIKRLQTEELDFSGHVKYCSQNPI